MKLRQLTLFQHPEAATPVKPAELKRSSPSVELAEEGDDLHDLTGSPLKCSFTLDDNLDLDVLPSTGKARGYLSTLI